MEKTPGGLKEFTAKTQSSQRKGKTTIGRMSDSLFFRSSLRSLRPLR
jgi:hypothetical protein